MGKLLTGIVIALIVPGTTLPAQRPPPVRGYLADTTLAFLARLEDF